MPSDWKRAIRASGHTVSGNEIRVRLAGEREHRVVVTESDACLVFTGRVAGPSAVRALDDALLRAWLRNRGTKLVGFRIDDRGWLIGEAWAPSFLNPGYVEVVRESRGRVIRVGWRETLEQIIRARVPGVTREAIAAKLNVPMKWYLGEIEGAA